MVHLKSSSKATFIPRKLKSLDVVIFISVISAVGILLLLVVAAATKVVSVDSQAQLAGSVSKVGDAGAASGSYMKFGASGGSGGGTVGAVLPPGELPAYPAAPAGNGTTVQWVSNYGDMMAAINNPSVRTVVLEDGNYVHPQKKYVSINGVQDKLIMAEHKHGARIEHASYKDYDGMHITNTKNVTIRGLEFVHPRDYAIKMGGQGYSPSGPNEGTIIEFVKVRNSGRGGFNVNSGFGSECGNGSNGVSRNITIRYNEFFLLGMAQPTGPEVSGAGLAEGIYTGSGGSCQSSDKVDGIKIYNNLFDGTGQNSGGEAIGAKVFTSNLLVENNQIKNWRMRNNTDGAVISAWIDVGQPPGDRSKATAGKDGIVIKGNYIDGVSPHPGSSVNKARGIMVGHAATIENNTIKNTVGAAIGVTLHGYTDKLIWGFSIPSEATVTIRNNSTSNNKTVLDHDYSQANFPITINYSGNVPELTPFSISNVTFNKQ